ncbi:MAG: PAS domain S-box protein [Bacteroidales bacterium]
MTHLDKLLQSIPIELHQPSRAFLEAGDQIGLYWWYWFREGNLLFLSPGLIRELGHDPATYDPSRPGTPDNIHPRDVKRNREFFMQLVRGHSSKYELTYRVRDGKKGWKWFYNRGVVMPGKPGEAVSVIAGITMDLSGRFQDLLIQVEDSEKFEFLFRHNTEAALIIEIRDGILGRVLDANQAALDLFGEDTPQMKGEVMLDEGEDEMFRRDGPLLSQLKRKGYLHFERKMNLAYRGELWLEFHVHLFNKSSEDLILALVSDKTSGKRTEAALRDSERLYKTLFEAADDRIVLFDETGQTLFFSRSYYKALGYTRREFEALKDTQVIHPDDLPRLETEGRTLFETGSSAHEYRVRHKDGTYLDMASKNVLIPTDPGEKRLVLSVSRDVSQRKRDMQELMEAKERAEESDRLKSAFLANMSHEIRTPMNSIMGFSSLLEEEDLGPGERIMYIQRITRNTETLLKLISDIIDLSKIESGQLPLVIGKLKVRRLLEELREFALDEVARRARRGGGPSSSGAGGALPGRGRGSTGAGHEKPGPQRHQVYNVGSGRHRLPFLGGGGAPSSGNTGHGDRDRAGTF